MLNSEDMLSSLKIEIGITANAYNERLIAYLDTAKQRIAEEGITLADTVEDATLVIQYAAWMWMNRNTGTGMPRMLRYALNNRLFAGKMKDETSV